MTKKTITKKCYFILNNLNQNSVPAKVQIYKFHTFLIDSGLSRIKFWLFHHFRMKLQWVPINVITDNVITFLQVQEMFFFVATGNWLSDKKWTPIMLSFSFRSIITDNVITFLQVSSNEKMFFIVQLGDLMEKANSDYVITSL
jgi:hypothetical protein